MREHINIRWRLVVYDILILSAVEFLLLAVYRSNEALTLAGGISQAVLSFLCVFLCFADVMYKRKKTQNSVL